MGQPAAYKDVEWNSEAFKGSDFEKFTLVIKKLFPWMVLSVIVFLVLGNVYMFYKTKKYHSSALILIKDEKDKMSSNSSEKNLLQNLGFLQSGANVENEIHILKSDFLFSKTIADLALQVEFIKRNNYNRQEIFYGSKLPFHIKIDSCFHNISDMSGNVQVRKDGLVFNSDSSHPVVLPYGRKTKLPFGFVTVEGNEIASSMSSWGDIYEFRFQPLEKAIKNYYSSFSSNLEDKKTTLIRLDINTEHPEISSDILNRLIDNYQKANVEDNNRVVDSTISFITVRLDSVSYELSSIENEIEKFKVTNNIADLPSQSKVAIEEIGITSEKASDLHTQISVVNSLIRYMKENVDHPRIIPASLTIQNVSLTEAINGYNALLFQKDRLLINYKVSSPQVEEVNRQIMESRLDLLNNLKSVHQGLDASLSDISRQLDTKNANIRDIPLKERIFLSLSRQQNIKQELFLFLLQKKEEAAISRSSTVSNCKVIDTAKPDAEPVSPKRRSILIMSTVLGLIAPFIFYYSRNIFSFKVNDRMDLNNMSKIPIVGEIAYVSNSFLLKKNIDFNRDILKEQFRIIRSNIQFLINNAHSNCILINSSIASEGKSFFSINLASILALSGRKVIILELDLRKPTISTHFQIRQSPGFTDYIVGSRLLGEVMSETDHKNVYVMPAGTKAPNPTELLLRDKVEEMFVELRKQFDYIIIDSAPNIVADSKALLRYSDLLLFIVRAGVTPKSKLNEFIGSEFKIPVGFVLNCSKQNIDDSYRKYYN